MKELNAQQTELLINYLNGQINSYRTMAEEYRKAGKYDHAMIATAKACEHDCTLAYLMGLLHDEKP